MLETRKVKVGFSDSLSRDLLSQDHIESVRLYEKKLQLEKAAIIYSLEHFSKLIGVKSKYIGAVANSTDHFYRRLRIRKRDLSYRTLHEPLPLLKEMQLWILHNILEGQVPHPAVKSYRKGYSIKDNAKYHVNKKYIHKYDLEDFFGSVNYLMVRNLFHSIGYSTPVSVLLARLCTLRGSLPQGAPTSGAISNLVLSEFDSKVFDSARALGLIYTRYADDITISGKEGVPSEIDEVVKSNITRFGFRLNNRKCKIIGKNNQQKVTGIVVNEKMNIPRSSRERIRQELYYIQKYGFLGHCSKTHDKNVDDLYFRLLGQLSHYSHIRPKDKWIKDSKNKLKEYWLNFQKTY